jgi:mannose-6-phosphate isomerase-like protein (cupin superfamily)|tara:strand:- start:173 stop:535 length:363 start_codon:yes stop_codon:yes gene_type:complete
MHTHLDQIESYITKDGSRIRELMHPDAHSNINQSLAEATVPAGIQTELHLHKKSEEIYHITQGEGLMSLGDQQFLVNVGDTVCIPTNTAHKISNVGKHDLVFLCACSPAYTHDDTVIIHP